MTALDALLILFILASAVHGAVRGIRGALRLTVIFLASMLAAMLLIAPLERGALRLSNINPADYPGAPAVAVLILNQRSAAAYLTALIPLFIMFIALFVPTLFGPLMDRFAGGAAGGAGSAGGGRGSGTARAGASPGAAYAPGAAGAGDAGPRPGSRIGGGLLGTVNGALIGLIAAAALTRLPWPPAAPALRGSLILSAVNHLAEPLIPRLAGAL